MDNDINIQILKTLIQGIKSQKDIIVKYRCDDCNVYSTILHTNHHRVNIWLYFHKTKTWFSKEKIHLNVILNFTLKCDITKKVKYEYGKGCIEVYNKYKQEIYALLSKIYESNNSKYENEQKNIILESLESIVDEKNKRESNINNIIGFDD